MEKDNRIVIEQSTKELGSVHILNCDTESKKESELYDNLCSEEIIHSMRETIGIFLQSVNLLAERFRKQMCECIGELKQVCEIMLKGFEPTVNIMIQRMVEVIKQCGEHFETLVFIEISEEIGFPLYLKINSELKIKLIESYRKHGMCNEVEMKQILFEHYSNDYIDKISKSIINSKVFKTERLALIEQGFEVYTLGFYGAANALFVTQINGMIRDIFAVKNSIVEVTSDERNEVVEWFGLRKWKDDSEIIMLLDVLYYQMQEALIWQWVGNYFRQYVYSSGKKHMDAYPKRHMICHGIQTNFDSKEMSLKLIMCMDILTELAWRVSKMKKNDIYIECSYK